MDTRTAVWISTAEKCFKIVLGETRNFSRKLGGGSAPALHKNLAVIQEGGKSGHAVDWRLEWGKRSKRTERQRWGKSPRKLPLENLDFFDLQMEDLQGDSL